MHLTDGEFDKLQNLANISFSGEEKKVFLEKLEGVIDFLGQLNGVVYSESVNYEDGVFLEPKKGVEEYNNPKGLLDNVEHEVMNDSIIVKSVFS